MTISDKFQVLQTSSPSLLSTAVTRRSRRRLQPCREDRKATADQITVSSVARDRLIESYSILVISLFHFTFVEPPSCLENTILVEKPV